MKPIATLALTLALGATFPPARAANIVAGDVTAALGPAFFVDAASTGGGDNNATSFTRDFNSVFNPGATVTLKGLGWASPSAGITNTAVTATFTDLGPDNAIGTTDDVVVGIVTDNLIISTVASEYVWDFNSDIVFTATGTTLRVVISSPASIRRKTTSTTATGSADVKLSLAGSATPGTPPPIGNTATVTGFWETITWNTGSGTVTGGVQDGDTALIGQYRTVTYRGQPANESLTTLNLGDSSTNQGQGILQVNSGTLNVTGNLTVGRNHSANDSFVHVNGGTLHVGGSAVFGRSIESCDGSLIVAGGKVTIVGGLAMGGFEQGGAMLRFHNPGSSPVVDVGGTLNLGRCALDLTFDNSYVHTPGQVVTLITYGARQGQFVNFRRGEEFNCGPNRFRIAYDTGGNSITLTALANWPASPSRPNIILIFSDDGGYADLGLHGNPKFPTPQLNSLAASGARFTDAYVTGAVCHPSRCGLLTGRYQQRTGSENNLTGPSYNGMAASQPTVPRRLQGLGYRTYGIGKWHMGNTVDFHPNLRGFDRWYGMQGGGRSYYDNTTESGVFENQMTPDFASENTGYLTDRIGDSAIGFIDAHLASSHAAEPFFIYVSFTAIHSPMDILPGDPRFARLQNEFGLTAASYQNSPIVFSGSNQATVDTNRYELAAMTLAMDEQIGKITQKLHTQGITNKTLIVYTNDNGGAGWTSSAGGNFSYNTPLRGYKGGTMTEGAIRVAGVATWPGTIPSGGIIPDPVISLDWGATFVNAAGDSPAAARNGLDGLDLLPRMKLGTPLPADRVLFWRAGGTAGSAAARMGDWKMLKSGSSAATLYNLRSNIAESVNLASSQPAILAGLMSRFQAWETRTLPPFYGTADTVLDPAIERQAITGGLRLKTASTSPLWQSSSLRDPLSLAADFDFSFMLRATENGPYPANAGLWQGLGDSATRSALLRCGIDFGTGRLAIVNGKAGTSASTPLPALPTEFALATLRYRASSGSLTLALGSTSVSLPLAGGYGALTTHAMGCSAMEGEITTLRAVAAGADGTEATTSIQATGNPLMIGLDFRTEPPFDPRLERSPDLGGFTADDQALLESLGGGRYRSKSASSVQSREFFRFRLNQP